MNKNKIIFEAQTESIFETRQGPIPASKIIPQWWKDIPKYSLGNTINVSGAAGVTVKQCAPTMDMFGMGYIITLWADLLIEQTSNGPKITWTSIDPIPPVSLWPEKQVSGYEIPNGFNKNVFKYHHGWIIKTPPGWSTLFIHPHGYQNLPIRSLGGIVDTDILKTDINCPFVVKDGFSGLIKRGTPIVQMIPIKRQEWHSETILPKPNNFMNELYKLSSEIYGYYSSRRERKNYK